MDRICTAPSAGPACGLGAGAGLMGTTFEYPNACATSAGSVPPNRIEKKLRNASETRFIYFILTGRGSKTHSLAFGVRCRGRRAAAMPVGLVLEQTAQPDQLVFIVRPSD